MVTGAFLMFFYAPTPDDSWQSLKFLTENFFSGRLLRSLHVWGSSLIVIAATLHILRVVLHGAYKRPRELNWISGLALFLVILGLAFTGYLLPWDQKGYWATEVGTRMVGEAPGWGPFLVRLMSGGEELGAYTLTRFYALHVVFLPALLVLLALLHLYLVRKHKIAPHPLPEKRTPETIPFYPHQLFRDSVSTLIVFLILLLLALAAPAGLEPIADPTDTSYDPRPDWYFLAHYELLRLFEGHQIIPVVILPTLIILLLFLLPWLDGSEHRHWKKRKAAVACVSGFFLLMYGAVAYSRIYHPAARAESETRSTGKKELPLPVSGDRELVLRGRRVFELAKCITCHQVGGIGGLQGPNLSEVGRKHMADWIREQILNPQSHNPKTTMPSFAGKISEEDLRAVVEYVSNFR